MTMAHSSPPARKRPRTAGAGTPAQQQQRSPRRRLLPRIIMLAVTLALLVGIFALVHANTSTGAPASSVSSSTGTNTTGASTSLSQRAPDFTLATLGGSSFQLAAQRGHIVVLYFMAPTCPSCVQGSRDLAQALLSAKTPGAEALAIDLNPGDTSTDLQAFVKSVGAPAQAPIRWGLDTNGSIASAYGVQVLEATVVINAQGQVAYQNNGPVAPDQLAQIVRNLA